VAITREVPMDLTALPIQQCPKSNIFALIYGEGGTGKGQLALRIAYRLTAPHKGHIVALEADGDRMRHHALRPDGTGFPWRPIKFPKANPDRLTKIIGELADAAAVATVPIAVIVDGASRFWNDPGGFKDRAEEYGGVNSKGQANLKGWGPVKAEEKALYMNLQRLKMHAHIIMCFEQTGEFVKQEPVGVKLDARKGITHEADFIFRMERHLKQEATAHETNLKKGAADVHRAIVEKTALVKLRPKDDGTVDFKYPMPTGTVFIDPGPALADLMVTELDGIDNTLEAETSAYLEQLQTADRHVLREAWQWVTGGAWWPEEVKEQMKAAINELATGGTPAPAQAAAATAEMPYAWGSLTINSRVEEWVDAAEKILDADHKEVKEFEAHAKTCERLDDVIGYVNNRKEELEVADTVAGSGQPHEDPE
jgi:hypothetical protein